MVEGPAALALPHSRCARHAVCAIAHSLASVNRTADLNGAHECMSLLSLCKSGALELKVQMRFEWSAD